MAKSVKPTGHSIARNGSTFTLTWKIGDKDYGNGQQLQYRVDDGGFSGSIDVKGLTSYTISGNFRHVQFRVRGNRKRYKDSKNRTHNPGWSDWASSPEWRAVVPPAPSNLEYTRLSTNQGRFKWSVSTNDTNTEFFLRTEYQTCKSKNTTNPPPSGWESVGTAGASGEITYSEETEELAQGPLIRWFRARTIGTAGATGWVYKYHAYGAPSTPSIISASAENMGSYARITAEWNDKYSILNPIDSIEVQYAIAVPSDADLTAPVSGWSKATEVAPNGAYNKVITNISETIDVDECIWVRIAAEHDGQYAYSEARLALVGKLATPEISASPNVNTGIVAISITRATSCDAAYTLIYYRSENDKQNRDQPKAVLLPNETSVSIEIDEIKTGSEHQVEHSCFGAYQFIGTYTIDEDTGDPVIGEVRMRSDSAEDTDLLARPPFPTSVAMGERQGTVRYSWGRSWESATHIELSWADHDDAWESTDEPDTYSIESALALSWIIAPLELGKKWFFRARFLQETDADSIVGPWSEIIEYSLSSVPDRPVLSLNKNVVNEGDSATGRWAFASEDGTTQEYAEICLAEIDEGVITYGDVIAHAYEEQSAEISYDWETNKTYYLCVRTTSNSGKQSEWSEPVGLFAAQPITIDVTDIRLMLNFTARDWELNLLGFVHAFEQDETVTTFSTSMVAIKRIALNQTTLDPHTYSLHISGLITFTPALTVHENDWLTVEGYSKTGMSEPVQSLVSFTAENLEKYKPGAAFIVGKGVVIEYWWREVETVKTELKALPLYATATGAGDSGTTTMVIARAEDYHIYRPDDSEFDGYRGEQIASFSQEGEDEITFNASDMVGHLDDGAKYTLEVTVKDNYGQVAKKSIDFTVNWTHKAGVPNAAVKIDKYQKIAIITPIAPEGAAETDVCDIYRLSADAPELICEGAQFGEAYVDPYPAFGEFCGHRIVTKTANGDYATADGLGWFDADMDVGDIMDSKMMVIDVDGEQIELPYNVELANTWQKDFQRTQYLGGGVVGDWNPAILRNLEAGTTILRGRDVDKRLSMRNLAGFAGPAHIRTPDGSSFLADIQVRENSGYSTKRVTYSLSVKKIDSQELDGMTLEEWKEMHPVE